MIHTADAPPVCTLFPPSVRHDLVQAAQAPSHLRLAAVNAAIRRAKKHHPECFRKEALKPADTGNPLEI